MGSPLEFEQKNGQPSGSLISPAKIFPRAGFASRRMVTIYYWAYYRSQPFFNLLTKNDIYQPQYGFMLQTAIMKPHPVDPNRPNRPAGCPCHQQQLKPAGCGKPRRYYP